MKPRYYKLSRYFEEKFGRRVWKVSVDAGLECPNRGGCIFCDATSFSPSRRLDGVAAALEREGKQGLAPFGTKGACPSFPGPGSSGPVSSDSCSTEDPSSVEREEMESGGVGKGVEKEVGKGDKVGKGDRHLLPSGGDGISFRGWQKEPVPFSVHEQIDRGIQCLRRRYEADRFVAYFQPSTNTNAPVEVLRELYREAIDHPAVVGLIVGTRPDCVSDEVIRLLDELSREVWVSLELGLQTIHDRSLEWLGRGHDYAAFLDTVDRCRSATFDLGAHVILGIPGESREEILATADELTRLEIDSVKLHNLYAVRGTPLAEMVQAGEFQFGTLQQYVNLVVAFLERLRPECVVDRLTGEAPPDYLVGPAWCLKKAVVIQRIEEALQVRQTWQGRLVEEGRATGD